MHTTCPCSISVTTYGARSPTKSDSEHRARSKPRTLLVVPLFSPQENLNRAVLAATHTNLIMGLLQKISSKMPQTKPAPFVISPAAAAAYGKY